MCRPSNCRPSLWHIWFTAARPHTLTASISPCLVAAAATRPPAALLVLWMIFCVTVQLGTNLHNDYSDYVQGADTDKRVGQPRATAQGWLTPAQTCTAACLCLSMTLLSGILLAVQTNQLDNIMVWFLILSSVFNAFAYTAGPFPLGYIGLEHCSIAYAGLGDVFVFIYFGLVAVLMLPFLLHEQQQHQKQAEGSSTASPIDWSSQWLYACQVGFLAINIIVVNNLRDRHTDVWANKRTTAVRFGRTFSLVEYGTCQVLAYGLVLVNAWMNTPTTAQDSSIWVMPLLLRLLPLLSIPLAVKEFKAVLRKEGQDLNLHVGGAAKVQLAFCVLLAAGLFGLPL